MMILPVKTITFSAILYMVSLSTFAADAPGAPTSESEAAHLAIIAKEIEAVRVVAQCDKAKMIQPSGSRLWFDYKALCKALSDIEYGVRSHLVLRNSQPSLTLQLGVVGNTDGEEEKR